MKNSKLNSKIYNLIGKGLYIDQENGRVYINAKFVGFGILDLENSKIHITHNKRGVTHNERIAIPIK